MFPSMSVEASRSSLQQSQQRLYLAQVKIMRGDVIDYIHVVHGDMARAARMYAE